jgi:hypothetical protein
MVDFDECCKEEEEDSEAILKNQNVRKHYGAGIKRRFEAIS